MNISQVATSTLNVDRHRLKIGDTFNSFQEFNKRLTFYKEKYYVDFYICDSRSLECARRRYPRRVENSSEDLKYLFVKYNCVHGGTFKGRQNGRIRKTSTIRRGCEAFIYISLDEDGTHLKIQRMSECHNHVVSKDLFNLLPNQRRFKSFSRKQYLEITKKAKAFRVPVSNANNSVITIAKPIIYTTFTSIPAETKENTPCRSHFQQEMFDRKMQAHRSILLEVPNKDNIASALAVCQRYGKITSAFSHPSESDSCFVLLEFSNKNAVEKLLLNCQCKNIGDAFPVYSRLIQFEKILSPNYNAVDIDVVEENVQVSSLKAGYSISDVIEDVYRTEKLSQLNTRLRYFFCSLIKDSISGLFPFCDVLPFGSSVNGIGRHGCDLDVMIRLYPEQKNGDGELCFLTKTCIGDVRALQQKTIFSLGDYIRTFFPGVTSIQKILHARVPILKLKHKILKIDCDVSINNMSAIFMSDIIHFCGEIDPRVRPLMYAVKKWAKEAKITYSAPGTYITNFGLTTLVIFFLQNRPICIIPPFNDFLIIQGEDTSDDFRIQYLKSIFELNDCASQNKESLAELLKELLKFLATYSFKDKVISIMTAEVTPRKNGSAISLQYPFEEGLNITKNVSEFELTEMAEKAKHCYKYLNHHMKEKVCTATELGSILGISSMRKESNKSKKITFNSVLDENVESPKNRNPKRRPC